MMQNQDPHQKRIRKIPPHILSMLQEVEDLKFEGHYQEAITLAEKILHLDPSNVPALEEIADNYLSLNELKKAERAANRAIQIDPDSYTSYYIQGFIQAQKQNWEESIRLLQKANTLHPNNPEILRCLGWSVYNSNNKTKGLVTLERALNLDPNNILTLCDLGMCYLYSQKIDKSLSLFYKALEIDPENDRAKECILAAQDLHKKLKSR